MYTTLTVKYQFVDGQHVVLSSCEMQAKQLGEELHDLVWYTSRHGFTRSACLLVGMSAGGSWLPSCGRGVLQEEGLEQRDSVLLNIGCCIDPECHMHLLYH